jgi:hypothetical protein
LCEALYEAVKGHSGCLNGVYHLRAMYTVPM